MTSAFQGRNAGGKRKRRASVRRSSKRQAQLTLSRVEPWSVMKFSFVVSVVAFIILFVAVAVLYMVLSALGVFTSLQHTVNTITSSQGSPGTNISNWFSMSRILGYTGMLGALNIVLITAMSTIGAVVYNLIASYDRRGRSHPPRNGLAARRRPEAAQRCASRGGDAVE